MEGKLVLATCLMIFVPFISGNSRSRSSASLADIVRPCKFNDYKCIGNNLASNSYCSKNVKGTLPNKYLVKDYSFETPYFNATHIDRKLIVKNHDKCFVSEFFINTNTDNAVLTVDCPKLDLEADRVLIQHRSKKENEYYYYHIHAIYPMIRMTVELPSWTQMDLCRAQVFTEVVTLPQSSINPKDKRTANFLKHLDIIEREKFLFRGNFLMGITVNSFLCDYGCLPHVH